MSKILWFDTETGSLKLEGALLQLSGIIDIDGKVVEEFDFYIKPFKNNIIEDSALEVNGIKRDDIKNFEEPLIVKDKLLHIFDKYIDKYDKKDKLILAGHNIRFDTGVICEWFKSCNESYYGSYLNLRKKLDTLSLIEAMRVMRILPDSPNNKLGDLCEEYSIEVENLHNSMDDIRATRELAYKIGKLIKRNLKGSVF